MDTKLLELLRNIMDELDDLRYEMDREGAGTRHIAREILLKALIKDGESWTQND